MFYGSAQDNGGPVSDPNILTNGNITWTVPAVTPRAWAPTSKGWARPTSTSGPAAAATYTDFFQYIGPVQRTGSERGQAGGGYVGRTFGLVQASGGLPTPDPQWPYEGGANFAVNPVNGADVVISSSVGRIFATSNEGVTWFDVGDPGGLRQPRHLQPRAWPMAHPTPAPRRASATSATSSTSAPQTGQIYVTQDGGGSGTSNNWINISAGLNGSPSSRSSPTRSAAATRPTPSPPTGVFYMANSIPSATNPTPTWVNITGNINSLAYSIFGQSYNPTTDRQHGHAQPGDHPVGDRG